MENNVFAPMPEAPEQVARALGWRTSPMISAEESEELRAAEFFQRTTEISNHWRDKRVLRFSDDDARAQEEIDAAIEPIRKLFTPAAPARITPKLGEMRVLPPEDFDEAEFACPVKKLFFTDLKSVASPATQKLNKTADGDWDAPLEKTSQQLTYRKRVDFDGTVWNEGFDAAGEMKSAMVVYDETE